MESQNNKSEKPLENELLECKWCGKSFRTERTLSAHVCTKKRRWSDRDMSHVRLGLRAFQMFYETATHNSKPKSQDDFIDSRYYTDFVKFGRACTLNQWLDPERYTQYLIQNSVKLSEWGKDKHYNEYIKQYVKRESGLRALERTIISMAEWAADSECDWQDYFVKATTNRCVYDIRAAKISPWAIYLSNTGEHLLKNLNDEQVKLVNEFIDPVFWKKLFDQNKQEVQAVRSACEEAGF